MGNRMARGTVLTYAAHGPHDQHEGDTHRALARTLAELKGFRFGGEWDASALRAGPLYFVPGDTLLADEARRLGIRSEEDLFGGVVPFPFVATKSIVHPLVDRAAEAPQGWSHDFPHRVERATLPGFAAFRVDDARRAGLRLLPRGRIRLKTGHGVGGHGQHLAEDAAALEAALERLDLARLARFGVVVELDLADATTYSVGQVRAAGLQASYCGTQHRTTDNQGNDAFGGSDLMVVRGGFDALATVPLDAGMRAAVEQARLFDEATAAFPGFFASRRNYDALRGRDREGRWLAGILEQSWRIGGASGAEIAALAAFHADPSLRVVHARSTEVYGPAAIPPGAVVHYRGTDARVGALAKYTVVEAYETA